MSSRRITSKFFVLLVFLSFLLRPALSQISVPPKKGEVSGKIVQISVSDFTLLNQEETPLSLKSLRGKVVVITFIYTTCPDVCPLLTAKFAEIQRRLKKQNRDDYFLLSITTDPEVDTPDVLKSYAERFGADFHTWAFLTGNKKTLAKVWDAFGVKAKKLGNGQVRHKALTAIVDRQGIRRIDYYGDKWTEKTVLEDVATLAAGQ